MNNLISMLQTSSKSINKAFIHSVLFVERCGLFSLPCSGRFCEEKKSVDVEWETRQVEVLRLKGSEAWSLLY